MVLTKKSGQTFFKRTKESKEKRKGLINLAKKIGVFGARLTPTKTLEKKLEKKINYYFKKAREVEEEERKKALGKAVVAKQLLEKLKKQK